MLLGVAGNSSARDTTFSADAYLKHVKFLASDALEGRATGTPGNDQAATYVVDRFKACGLKPGGVDGGWYQPFEVTARKVLDDTKAKLEVDGAPAATIHRDWSPFPFSGMERVEGPLAFVGYGIKAEPYEYNDYRDFSVEGKILLIFRYEPGADDPDAAFGGTVESRYALFRRKAETAVKEGAKALIIVDPPNHRDVDSANDELYPFRPWNTRATYDLPVIHVTRHFADRLLKAAKMPSLEKLQRRLESERQPLSQDMELNATIDPGLAYVTGRNVIGLLPGASRPDEYVVVGAHYDHLGNEPTFRDRSGPAQIHNGADDNASGTAGLIELARALAGGPRPARSILFIAFSGEELGLFGSRHYVREPTVPLEAVKAMVNFDMIGRLRPDLLEVTGVPTAEEFETLVETAAASAELAYSAPTRIRADSDHAPFHRKNIPVIFVFTGMHKDYHRPTDDWEEINPAGAIKILKFGRKLVTLIADSTDGPTPVVQEREESSSSSLASDSDRRPPPRRRSRIRLDIMPQYNDDQAGLLIERVVRGGAAAKGGMKNGDRIVKIEEHTIDGIRDYMKCMSALEADRTVDVLVRRGDEELTLKIRLREPGLR